MKHTYHTRYSGEDKSRSKRRLGLVIGLVFLVFIVALFAIRWQAWFGNKPELAYNTPEQIDRLTITPGVNFATERTITWRCGEQLQSSWLRYARVEQDLGELQWQTVPAIGRQIETRSGVGCFYTVTLRDLDPGAEYVYEVKTSEVRTQGQLRVPAGLDTLTRFVYLGDVQDPSGDMSRKLFEHFRRELGTPSVPHFIAAAGDQIEGPTDEYWQVWYDAWGAAYLAQMPFILATGNHEYLKRGFLRELDPRWVAQYNYPDNGPEGFEGRSYYIDLPLVRFIVLDSNGINNPWSVWTHRSWLKEALTSSTQPWQVVMFHHAVECVRESRKHPIMSYVYRPVLEEGGADLVLQGHDHAYSRMTTKSRQDTIAPMYLISSSSPKSYRNGFAPVHDRLGSGLQLYQTIEVRPRSLHYRAHHYTGELYDDVELHLGATPEAPVRITDHARDWPERFDFNAFGSSAKGQKKAAQYREQVLNRQAQKRSKPWP